MSWISFKAAVVQSFARGQVTFGLRQCVWLAVAAVAISIAGAVFYS